MRFIILISILIAYPAICEETITITDKEVHDYWDFDDAKMSARAPNNIGDIIKKHQGSIHFKFTYLIDANGRPKSFIFISADPKSAEVEEKNLKKRVLYYRYKHDSDNKYKGATFVEADLYWWDPRHKTKLKPETESKLSTEQH